MARKMHCALQEVKTESPEASKPGKGSLSRKHQQQKIFTVFSKDCEKKFLSTGNSDSRRSIFAFLALGPDGNLRNVALPGWRLNHINLATGVIMELVLPTPLNRSKIDWHKGLAGPLPDYAYSVKSFMGRRVTGSNVHRRCQNKIANKAPKLNEISGSSCSHPLICSNSSGLFPNSSAAVNSSDTLMSNSKAEKSVKKKLRKKSKKKGRQSKKQSSDSGLTEPEVLPEEYASASLTSESCGSNNVDKEDVLMSYATVAEFSSSDDRLIKNDSERNEMDERINFTEAPQSCTSCTDEVEISEVEATAPVVHKSTGDSATCNSKNQVIDGKTNDTRHIQLCCYDDVYSKGSSDMQDSLVLDSVSVASNSDESTNTGDFEKQSNMTNCRIGHLQSPDSNSGDEFIPNQNLLNAIGNGYDQNEGIRHGAQNCSSSNKRVKQKRTSGSSNVNKFGGVGNFYGRTGTENSHSVWQKVQKNSSEKFDGDIKKVNTTLTQFGSNFKETPSVNRNCKFVGVNHLSKTEDKKLLKNKGGRKSKGKMDPDSKNGYCSYSAKGSQFNRSILNDSAKISVQLNDMSQVSSQENTQEVLSSVSGSHSHINSPWVGFETNRIEQTISESVHSTQVHLRGSDPAKDVWRNISTAKNQIMENQDSSLSIPCDHISQSSVFNEQSPTHSHLLGHEVGQIEKEVSSADYNVQNHSSRSILWKWIPIGKKDAGLAITESDSSSQDYSDKPAHKDSTVESNVEPEVVSFSQNHVPLLNESGTCMGQISSNFSCLDKDENKKLRNQVVCALTKHREKYTVANHSIYECQYQDKLENYSYRIAQAVNDVCRVQLACETVHMATGGPIAEFERLLHKCSPFICRSPSSLSCVTSSEDHANGILLCRHEMPDLSLGCLWQWYEKHGSYGLEIRAQECNSKRLGGGHFPFRAYFVPSLSAVQLFKNQKIQCIHGNDKFPNHNMSEACEISDMSEHSSAASPHPIFSVLFPQPCNQEASIPTPRCHMHCSQVPSSAKDNVSGPFIDSACSGDLELLFEYFESEQPQQRWPLYEKIQELVSGNIPAQSKVYGDPTLLDSVNLQDLHPRSWYSVAWYPVYRIPDGNLRAAFLTYHSLGHLIRRSMKSGSPTVDSCMVSPVVGLQSYNAQGECWFQLRQSALSAEVLGLNPSTLLKERLRTLEETASLMARAPLNKGNLICTTRHPDYEFFLSRRR